LLAAVLGSACGLPGAVRPSIQDGYPLADAQQRRMREAVVPGERERVGPRELLVRGDRLRDQGDLPGAVFQYLRALQSDPRSTDPRLRLGFLHLRDHPARAQGVFEDILVRDPGSAQAHQGLGLAFLAQGEAASARVSLQRARDLGERSPLTLAALGVAHDRLGEFWAAQGFYREALDREPGNWQLRNDLGVSQMLAGDCAEAVESFRAALRRHEEPALWTNLGLALGRLRRYSEAEVAFMQAGDAAAAHNNLGLMLAAGGDFAAAVEHYERALLLGHPEKRKVLANLVVAQESLAALANGRSEYAQPAPVPRAVPDAQGQSMVPWIGQSVDQSLWSR
jgi:Flp pilus assembly protein TadD